MKMHLKSLNYNSIEGKFPKEFKQLEIGTKKEIAKQKEQEQMKNDLKLTDLFSKSPDQNSQLNFNIQMED